MYLTLPFNYFHFSMHNDTHPPQGSNDRLTPGSNIWGSKFAFFGLAVILLFAVLIGARACYLGVPLTDVFKNTDPTPTTTLDSTSNGQ